MTLPDTMLIVDETPTAELVLAGAAVLEAPAEHEAAVGTLTPALSSTSRQYGKLQTHTGVSCCQGIMNNAWTDTAHIWFANWIVPRVTSAHAQLISSISSLALSASLHFCAMQQESPAIQPELLQIHPMSMILQPVVPRLVPTQSCYRLSELQRPGKGVSRCFLTAHVGKLLRPWAEETAAKVARAVIMKSCILSPSLLQFCF